MKLNRDGLVQLLSMQITKGCI